MKNAFPFKTTASKQKPHNIFSKRGALIVYYLLQQTQESHFSINGVAREVGVSVGLTQKVISALVHSGIVEAKGQRTAKKYKLRDANKLLALWRDNYIITNKCKFYNYRCGYDPDEVLKILSTNKIDADIVFALHTACLVSGYEFTNLNKTEMYLMQKDNRDTIEKLLRLEPVDRGYDVLIIEPYYDAILEKHAHNVEDKKLTPALLNYLDLYHYPLRGKEQAEHLLRRHPDLKHLSGAMNHE